MKVYLDSDVIIDYLYQREFFYKNAGTIIAMAEKRIIQGYVSSLIIWNIYYLLAKYLGEKEARKKIKMFRHLHHLLQNAPVKIISTV